MKRFYARVLYSLFLIACACNLAVIEPPGGGGGIETVGLAGTAVYANSGLPAAGAQVRVRSAGYLAGIPDIYREENDALSKDVVTDSTGRFSIDFADTGFCLIEINDGGGHAVIIRRNIQAGVARQEVGRTELALTGTITGSAGVSVKGERRFARVYGLERYAKVDANGLFSLTDLPPGVFDLQFIGNDTVRTIDRVTVSAGAATTLPPVGWRFQRKLTMNTTASGADVNSLVTGFPILIRLNTANFDFSEAKPGGNDLRFVKTDGTALPFSIARWERVAGVAEVWVRLDTVFGNDSTHGFLMLWGNGAAVSASSDRAVFAADNGFAAVWHLDADCRDASAAGHHGTNYGAADAAGIIGTAKKFNGSDSIVVSGLLGQRQRLTLSAWVAADTLVSNGQEIVSIGDAVLLRSEEKVNTAGLGGYYYAAAADSFVPVSSGRLYAGTGWHHAVFAVDCDNHIQSLYIDGALVKTMHEAEAIDYSGLGGNTLIGGHARGKTAFNSRGTIDEVRVCAEFRSADWVRLCYMNQRPDDRLVVFR